MDQIVRQHLVAGHHSGENPRKGSSLSSPVNKKNQSAEDLGRGDGQVPPPKLNP
ncbi:hypothetical protein EDC27_1880 [Desulfosoma caldarium]|uniref:Uncharacterized protein n=1 Tax=Desulfosoma caldarium TaxID=610254 RepID=A0A3N1UR16_9BACT|nr:hypothetical protein EDC27_1880 [Desulfosoma caldarium]